MPDNEEYTNLPFIDRVSEAMVEFQLAYQASQTNGVKIDEVVSLLSENGFGDNVSDGRVSRAAQRLINEGKAMEKSGRIVLTESGMQETNRVVNLVARLAPDEARAVESPE